MRILKMLPGLVFGLMFLAGGLFFMWQFAGTTFVSWQHMQSWQASQASLLEVSGRDNSTYARYRYEVSGVSYESERVSVTEFNDNIGDYQKKLQWRLSKMHKTGQAISIWVNPLDSSQAVIDRDMRWGLFAFMVGFCSMFMLIGTLVIIFSLKQNKKTAKALLPNLKELRNEWQKAQKDPDYKETFVEYRQRRIQQNQQQGKDVQNQQSWKTRKGWQGKAIRSTARNNIWVAWGAALFANGFVVPFLPDLYKEFVKGNYGVLLILIFVLVGILLVYRAINATLEYMRFGKVLFEMDPFPGAIGGHVGGYVVVPKLSAKLLEASEAECSIRLECVYSYVSGSGDNRSRKENIRWAQRGEPKVSQKMKGVALGFRFDIPDHLPSSDVVQKNTYNFWRLIIKADIKGVDLNREYNIPVFKDVRGNKTSRHVRHDVSAQVIERKQQASQKAKVAIEQGDFDVPGLMRAMKYVRHQDEIRLSFSMFRSKMLVMFAAIFAGGFGFASVSMVGIAIKGGVIGIVVGIFSLPFLLVAIVSCVAFVYMAFNNFKTVITPNNIQVVRRLLFIPIVHRHWNSKDLSHLSIKRSGSTGQGVDKVEHFKVLAHHHTGKSVTLAEDIDGEANCEHFKEYLSEHLKLKSPVTASLMKVATKVTSK